MNNVIKKKILLEAAESICLGGRRFSCVAIAASMPYFRSGEFSEICEGYRKFFGGKPGEAAWADVLYRSLEGHLPSDDCLEMRDIRTLMLLLYREALGDE